MLVFFYSVGRLEAIFLGRSTLLSFNEEEEEAELAGLLLWWKRTREMRIYGRTTWSSLVWSPIYVCHHVFSFGIQSLMHHWFLGICPIKSIQKDWHLSMEVLLGTTSWKLELLEVLLRIFFSTLATSTDVAPPWPPPVSPKKYQSESTSIFEMRFSCLELHSLPTCDNVLKYR